MHFHWLWYLHPPSEPWTSGCLLVPTQPCAANAGTAAGQSVQQGGQGVPPGPAAGLAVEEAGQDQVPGAWLGLLVVLHRLHEGFFNHARDHWHCQLCPPKNAWGPGRPSLFVRLLCQASEHADPSNPLHLLSVSTWNLAPISPPDRGHGAGGGWQRGRWLRGCGRGQRRWRQGGGCPRGWGRGAAAPFLQGLQLSTEERALVALEMGGEQEDEELE